MPTPTPARYQAHLRTPSPSLDAGLRGLTHYERKLPRWRYRLRQWLIPLVRSETPFLAKMQERFRTPSLDSYFAMTANLGTHTFFMTALPICFWYGFPDTGSALVHMLAAGVYLSGYVKDMVCLPRPLSPPLQRITMSGSAALEYGFPSTHTTNAVSVAVFCLFELWKARDSYSLGLYGALIFAALCYATSISVGRMYCGMHGILDVVFGAALGAAIGAVRILYGATFDTWIATGTWTNQVINFVILALAVRFHPEPADNCPCFDDSVAFIGVVMGWAFGLWHFTTTAQELNPSATSIKQCYAATNDDFIKAPARLVGGIILIFLWRAVTKPLLLLILPPIFRFVDHWGVRIPRRFFLQSRDYKTVPALLQDDKVLPPASEIPGMLSDIRRRKRTISVGPQSEADAREMIATREQNKLRAQASSALSQELSPHSLDDEALSPLTRSETVESADIETGGAKLMLPPKSDAVRPSFLSVGDANPQLVTPPISDDGRADEKSDHEMFSNLERPRVRYDVEVVTKLVVYAGIAWVAVEVNPTLFRLIGIA